MTPGRPGPEDEPVGEPVGEGATGTLSLDDVSAILQQLATELAQSSTADRIAHAVARAGLGLPGPPAVTVGVSDGPTADIRLRSVTGFPQESTERWSTIPRSAPVPLAEALKRGEPVYIDSREELARRYPVLADDLRWSDSRSWAIVPLLSAGGPEGVIGLAWSTDRRLGPREQLLLYTAAKLGGESLRRAFREEERRRLLLRVSDAADSERLAIAVGLHDDPVQRLAALSMQLGSLLARGPTVASADLVPVEAGIQHVLSSLRDLVFDLHPPDVHRLTLGEAIDDYGTWLFGGSVEVIVDDQVGADLPADLVRIGYRIVQEALTNVWKHAEARVANVLLTRRDDELMLRVHDDGVGVEAEGQRERERGHVGLQTIRERAESIGGWAVARAGPDGGFIVQAALPLPSG